MKFWLFVFFISSSSSALASVSGRLQSTTDQYSTHVAKSVADLVPFVSLELGDKYEWHTSSVQARWKTFVLVNAESKYPPEKFYGDVREAVVSYRGWSLGLDTGDWSTVALFHPLRPMKQGTPMLAGKFGSDNLNVELIYIPVQRAGQLPSEDSRWVASTYERAVTLDRALNNNAGVKIGGRWDATDLQFSLFEGAAPLPKLAAGPLLTPINYRIRTAGLSWAWKAKADWSLRGESKYQHTLSRDAALEPWVWSSFVAVETQVETVTLGAQLHYSKNPSVADGFISSWNRIYDQTAVFGARWKYSDDMVLTASALYNAIHHGTFWTAGFENKIDNHLQWGASWQNFSASGFFEKNNLASMDFVYAF